MSANGNASATVNDASFHSWLFGSTTADIANLLSVHLAPMTLKLESGLVKGDSYFLPCGCTVDELMEDPNESPGLHSYTAPGWVARAEQELPKGWLGPPNNGATVVSATPRTARFIPPTEILGGRKRRHPASGRDGQDNRFSNQWSA
ncbi:MAG TPA: hypothetical protein VNI83_01580 [Vicinamibacterales bacterium]|nr:hypothetical protein [Vicinamibacterales bacterium]